MSNLTEIYSDGVTTVSVSDPDVFTVTRDDDGTISVNRIPDAPWVVVARWIFRAFITTVAIAFGAGLYHGLTGTTFNGDDVVKTVLFFTFAGALAVQAWGES